MKFRLIVKALNCKPLFPARPLKLDEIKEIVRENPNEDSASILRAIKPYTEIVMKQTFTFSYEEVISSKWLSTLFAEKSLRVLHLKGSQVERRFSFKGHGEITGFEYIPEESLKIFIVNKDEWTLH